MICMCILLITDIKGKRVFRNIYSFNPYSLYIKIIMILIAITMFIGKKKEERRALDSCFAGKEEQEK